MSWFEHNGFRIYYEEHGSGDVVLLLPGFTQSAQQLSGLTATLATTYRVIACDLPGSGRSEPQPREYAATYFEDDAGSFAALLDHLGIGQARLIGFSDGGEIALLMAELTPDMVLAVVTWGAGGVLSDPSGQLRKALYNIIDDPIPPLKQFSDNLIATYGEANARAMMQSEASALDAIIDGERKGDLSLSKAGSIACPVLLMTGEHDMFVPPALLTQLASRIPRAESLVIEGAAHDAHTARPDEFAHTLLDWLKRH